MYALLVVSAFLLFGLTLRTFRRDMLNHHQEQGENPTASGADKRLLVITPVLVLSSVTLCLSCFLLIP